MKKVKPKRRYALGIENHNGKIILVRRRMRFAIRGWREEAPEIRAVFNRRDPRWHTVYPKIAQGAWTGDTMEIPL